VRLATEVEVAIDTHAARPALTDLRGRQAMVRHQKAEAALDVLAAKNLGADLGGEMRHVDPRHGVVGQQPHAARQTAQPRGPFRSLSVGTGQRCPRASTTMSPEVMARRIHRVTRSPLRTRKAKPGVPAHARCYAAGHDLRRHRRRRPWTTAAPCRRSSCERPSRLRRLARA